MVVAVTKNQTPLTDHRLFLDDPLIEFPPEDLDRTEVTPGITHVTSRLSAPARLTVAPTEERATRRESNARWFVGTVMLVVGLLAGYAAGVATVTRNAGDRLDTRLQPGGHVLCQRHRDR